MLNKDKIVTKDALSKVSRHFFKDFKMNYHRFTGYVHESLVTLLKFFETCPSDTAKSFFAFNMSVLCETLAMEQFKLALIVTKDRAFVTQDGLDRFTDELLIANEFNKVLYFNTFPSF